MIRHVTANRLSEEARSFNWLLAQFVENTAGVDEAICVSSDGLLMAASTGLDRTGADQFSAIVAGLTSLSLGAARCLQRGTLNQLVLDLSGGFLFVSTIRDGSCLGVLAQANCDIGLIGYEMTLVVERFGTVLTPTLVAELKDQPLL